VGELALVGEQELKLLKHRPRHLQMEWTITWASRVKPLKRSFSLEKE